MNPGLDLEKTLAQAQVLHEIHVELTKLVAINEVQSKLLRYTVMAMAAVAGVQGWQVLV